jgi:hypothetical protein
MYEEAGVKASNRKETREVRERKYKEHATQWRDAQKAQVSRPGELCLFSFSVGNWQCSSEVLLVLASYTLLANHF